MAGLTCNIKNTLKVLTWLRDFILKQHFLRHVNNELCRQAKTRGLSILEGSRPYSRYVKEYRYQEPELLGCFNKSADISITTAKSQVAFTPKWQKSQGAGIAIECSIESRLLVSILFGYVYIDATFNFSRPGAVLGYDSRFRGAKCADTGTLAP